MVYRYIKKSIQSRGMGVLFLFVAVIGLIASAYSVSDQLYVSGKSMVLATAHESGGNHDETGTIPTVMPMISFTSPNSGEGGGNFTIHGEGFIDVNSVLIIPAGTSAGYSPQYNVASDDRIIVFVPQNIPSAIYNVRVVSPIGDDFYPGGYTIIDPAPLPPTTPPIEEEEEETIPPVIEEEIIEEIEEILPEPLPPIEEPPFETIEDKIEEQKEIFEEILEEKKDEFFEERNEEIFEDKKEIFEEIVDERREVFEEIQDDRIETFEEIAENRDVTREEIINDQYDEFLGRIDEWDVDDFGDVEFDPDFTIETRLELKQEQKIDAITVNRSKEDFVFVFEEKDEEVLAFIDALVDEVVEEERLFEKRLDRDLSVDSDEDGISDYDEIVIYKTNPFNARTSGSDLTDSERILRGLDPLAEEEVPLVFENPQLDDDATPVEEYAVEEIENLLVSGTALPNSFVTLYIFSTPIIVTVKSDAEGRWTYELEEELEDGQHSMYVATVDNAGKIVARSNPIPFVKTANAAELGSFEAATPEISILARSNFLFAMIALAVLGLVIMILYVSFGSRREEVVVAETEEANNES